MAPQDVETFEDFTQYLQEQTDEYKSNYDESLCDSEDIEEFGLNEFIGGKHQSFEEILEIWNRIINSGK